LTTRPGRSGSRRHHGPSPQRRRRLCKAPTDEPAWRFHSRASHRSRCASPRYPEPRTSRQRGRRDRCAASHRRETASTERRRPVTPSRKTSELAMAFLLLHCFGKGERTVRWGDRPKAGPFNVSANARRRRSPSTLASDAERVHRAWGRPSFIRMPSVVGSRLARQVASHGEPDFIDKADVWRCSPHASVVRSGSFSFQLSPSVKVVENVGATNGVSSVSEAGDVVVRVRRRSRSAFLLPLSILRP
jgi:hypothetical protein